MRVREIGTTTLARRGIRQLALGRKEERAVKVGEAATPLVREATIAVATGDAR
jgi:hypothetical protein